MKFFKRSSKIMRKKFLLLALAVITVVTIAFPAFAYGDNYEKYKIYYEGRNTGIQGFYVKGNPYLPISIIDRYCSNPGVTVNEKDMQLEIDLSTQNLLMADDETTALVQNYGGKVYVPMKKLDGVTVFPLNVMEQFYKLSYTVSGSNIKLRPYAATEKIARISGTNVTAVASLGNEDDEGRLLVQNQRVYIVGETDNYYRIEDFDGEKYYVMKSSVKVEDVDLSKVDFYAPKKQKFVQAQGDKINLTWEYVGTVTPDAPERIDGIDIMAPTWFRLIVEGGGRVTNSADRGYTELCHENGYMVWATITNNMSESGSTNFTTKMFGTDSIMKTAIAQYIFYSCLYDVDGINIDFEDVRDADRDGLTAFTKNMRYYTERQGLSLSIDTLIPKPWTIEYDRKALAQYVDYLAIMTYDEHYSSSPEPGSIASLPWVEEAVQAALAEGVPANKLLMGIPLYTRIWVVDGSGSIKSKVASTMPNTWQLIRDNNASITYLQKEKQNYAEYATTNGTAKIWIEDEVSITNRLNLINRYDLAGAACWQFSQADNSIWSLFAEQL